MDIFPQSFFIEGTEGRDVSQEYRELELLSEVKLTLDSRVRVDSEGEVLGIYESFRGVKEAIERNDVDMALFFLARLNSVAKERLIYELQKGTTAPTSPYQTLAQRSVMEALGLSPENIYFLTDRLSPLDIEVEEIAYGKKPFLAQNFAYRASKSQLYYLVSLGKEEALEQALVLFKKTTKANRPDDASFLFSATLKSARVDFVNRVVESLSAYLSYPRVEEVVAEIEFVSRASLSMKDYILQQDRQEIELRYYSDALEGGNPRLFVYIFAISSREPMYDAYSLVKGYLTRRNLLDRYMCAQFFPSYDYALPATSSIDLYRILSQKLPEGERKDYALKFLSNNLGNVDILFYILDIYPEERDFIAQLLEDKHQGLYPLSERIVANVS